MKRLFSSFSFFISNLLTSVFISKLILGVLSENGMESIIRRLNFSIGEHHLKYIFVTILKLYERSYSTALPLTISFLSNSYGSYHKVDLILNYCDTTRQQELGFKKKIKKTVNLERRFSKLGKNPTVYLLGHWEFSKLVVLAEPLILAGSSVQHYTLLLWETRR